MQHNAYCPRNFLPKASVNLAGLALRQSPRLKERLQGIPALRQGAYSPSSTTTLHPSSTTTLHPSSTTTLHPSSTTTLHPSSTLLLLLVQLQVLFHTYSCTSSLGYRLGHMTRWIISLVYDLSTTSTNFCYQSRTLQGMRYTGQGRNSS